ncbi:calfacilitin-like [Microcaecilia unicolor]|uniref:Calfacilitin-like n=1 Tax=Microcaecilia unicolor TaxID=1415580 RepID=A0A6P7WU90_9AMPH|nr:calfacilitin-like [Microcaecilia unicolor]
MALQQYPAFLVLCSFLAFRALSRILSRLPLPQHVARDEMRSWRWRNLSVSMVHSLLTGTWALLCISEAPEMLTNISDGGTPFSSLLPCVSLGYFIADTVDMVANGQSRASWEFLLHHALVVPCFAYATVMGCYVSGAVIALLVEVNSVFLHTRLLLKLSNAQDSVFYRVNKYINLLTFICFRLGAQLYLTGYLMWNLQTMPHGHCFLLPLVLIDLIMLVYLQRLVRADFIPWPQDTEGRKMGKILTD